MLPTTLRSNPRLPDYTFSVVAGTVLSETVIPRTRGPGPPSVGHTALHYREFWVRQEDGTEIKLFADADQVQLREGHRMTLVVAERHGGAPYVVQTWNHDAPHYSAVVESSLPLITFDFPGQTSCMGLPGTAIMGAQLILAFVGSLMGMGWGLLSGGLFFMAIIALWFRRGERDRQVRMTREAALREHLSAITRALSLPAAGDGGAPGGSLR